MVCNAVVNNERKIRLYKLLFKKDYGVPVTSLWYSVVPALNN